jgi:hypothetical protein
LIVQFHPVDLPPPMVAFWNDEKGKPIETNIPILDTFHHSNSFRIRPAGFVRLFWASCWRARAMLL